MNTNQTTITFILKQLLLDGDVKRAENKLKRVIAKEVREHKQCIHCSNTVHDELCYPHLMASNHVNMGWGDK